MININEYLLSKNKKIENLSLDKSFNDIYEVADCLNNYFGDKLEYPIEVNEKHKRLYPLYKDSQSDLSLCENFVIEFKKMRKYNWSEKPDTIYIIRCGNLLNKGFMMQACWYRDYLGPYDEEKHEEDYDWPTNVVPYKYGTNFLEWLRKLKRIGDYKEVIKLFELIKTI